ncbi:DUF481 domain-containing protein [Myxococcaceae bacterium GXIMD 01537]
MFLSLSLLLGVLAQAPAPETSSASVPAEPPSLPAGYCKPPCEELEEEGEPSPWTGTAALSFLLLAGNSKAFTLTADGLAEYRTDRWALTLKGEGILETASTAEDEDDGEDVVAEALSVSARGEKRFTPLLGTYVFVGARTDHLASIELRLDGEAGVGFTLIERETEYEKEELLRLDLGLHYSNEARFQYFEDKKNLPDVDLLAPGVRLTFYYPINERLKFTQYAEFFPNILGDSRFLVESTSKVSAYITNRLALSTNIVVDVDTAPAEGKKVADLAVTLGAEFEF